MDSGDQVLSQSQIDAMFAATAAGGGSAAPPPERPGEPRPEPPIRESSGEGVTVADLAKRLEKLEETVVKLGRQEGTPADVSQSIKQLQQDIQTLAGHLTAINSKVEGLVSGLSGTVGYAARENFQCNECSAKGMVAAELTCTSCNAPSWWGWYPQKPAG